MGKDQITDLPPNNEGEKPTKKPNMSNQQLFDENALLKKELDYMESLFANTYSEIDDFQNALGLLKTKMKNGLNNTPKKQAEAEKMRNMVRVNQEKAKQN